MAANEESLVPAETPASEHPYDPEAIETVEQRKARYRQHLKQRTGRLRLKAFLLAKRNELKERDALSHSQHLQDTDQMSRYLNGQQYGDYDENGVYIPYKRMSNETCYSIPVLNGHVDQALMMLLKTQIQYECTAKDDTSPSHKALARMCEKLGAEDSKRLMDEVAQYDEALNSLVAGESYRLLIWGAHPEHPQKALIPQYKPKTFEIPASKICAECQYPLPAESVVCSHCNSEALAEVPATTETRDEFTGNKEVLLGENILHIPHMMGVKRDLSASQLKHSSYIIEIDYLTSRAHAEWLYQTPIDDTGDGTMHEAVRLRQQQERATIQTVPEGSTWPDRTRQITAIGVERVHIWMEPSEYGPESFDVDETLPDGSILKAGELMGDKYPNGFKYCTVGNTIVTGGLGLKKRQWSEVLYGKRAGSSRGAGLQTGIVLQDIINDCFNLGYATTQSSIPFRAVLKKFVQQLPPAGSVVMVDGLPPGGIGNAVAQFPAQTDSGAAGATAERIEQSMQFILGTNSLGGRVGAPDQKLMGTATGVAASVENANGRSIAPISQRVACDKEFRFQIIENIRDYSSKEQRAALAERFGPDVTDAFFECDFRRTVEWGPVKNTDKPRSDALTLSVMMEFGQIAANLAKSGAPWAIELLSEIADLAGIPFNIGPGRNDRREAENRLNKLATIEKEALAKDPEFLNNQDKAAIEMFRTLEESCGPLSFESARQLAEKQGAEDPDIDAAVPFYFMLEHDTFLDVYKDALCSEEAKMWSAAHKLVVIELWMEHFKAKTGAQGMMAQFQAMLAKQMGLEGGDDNKPAPPSVSVSFKDAAAFPSVAEQIVAAAGMDPSGMYPEKDESGAAMGEKIVEHELSEEAADAALKRDLVLQGHKAETDIAVATAKADLAPKETDDKAKPKPGKSEKK